MFAALSENASFFRPRMKLFVAMAPVVHLDNLQSGILKTMAKCEICNKAFKAIGPEILSSAAGSNPFKGALANSLMGKYSQSLSAKFMSDSMPELMSKKGYKNYGMLFPAGTSFQCLDHFN